MEDYLIYDIEVFEHYNLVVFSDLDNNITYFERDSSMNDEELIKVAVDIQGFIKDKILVGFNNYHYDDYILEMMITADSLGNVRNQNRRLINGVKPSVKRIDVKTLDCFAQLPPNMSLKKIQANLGMSIEESKVPFDLDRPLNEEEIEETIKYCKHDVETTKKIFEMRYHNYFEQKDMLLKRLEDSGFRQIKKAYRWNTTTISANLLKPNELDSWDDESVADYRWKKTRLPDKYSWLKDIAPSGAWNMWNNTIIKDNKLTPLEGKKFISYDFGAKIEWGMGGLHGVNDDNLKRFSNVKLLDFASLYPNLIIKLNALGSKTKDYQELLNERLAIKHTDKKMSDALKLIINSSYGLLNNRYSAIYNPYAALSVCIFGQLCIYRLCEKLYKNGCKLININTDGIAFLPNRNDEDSYKKAWEEVEKELNLKLELEEYKLFIQKDVNSYIAVRPDGSIKVKGGDVGKYNGVDVFKNTNNAIVDIALVDNLIKGIQPFETILKNTDKPILYQSVLSITNKFSGVCDENNNTYQKVNRVFPSKKGSRIYKMKNESRILFPDSPETMMIFNDDITKVNIKNELDVDYYIELVNKRLKRWT